MSIDLHGPIRRVILLLPAILALAGAWFVVHWYLGDTIAEYAPDTEEGGQELARLAVKWAPGDPFTHFVLGGVDQKEFSDGQLAAAVREYETAVRLSPNDYRYWMQLGRALEASGDIVRGEQTLRHAIELAPSYSFPRWYLGNMLLREGKQDDGLRELVRASQADPQLLPQVFNLTWEIFAGDADAVANEMCPTADARGQLAVYLVNRNEADDAMRIWTSISPRDRKDMREFGEILRDKLFDAGRFHHVLQVMRDIQSDASKVPEPEKFYNPSFESDTASRGAGKFGWAIKSSAQAEITLDHTQWHSGRGSLKIVFESPTNLDVINVSQLVTVEPDTSYRLEFYARTQDLRSGGTPVIEVLDPMFKAVENAMDDTADKRVLATSAALPDGTNEWQAITVEFRTRPKMEGVLVRIGRESCGLDTLCPIFGTVWYDDFNLQHFTGPVAASSAGGTRHAAGRR